ncbi:GlsB/YeaQ/YmgE family stress response membrane protein [Novosphingobium umbonatum]|uniref:GlsB/YeaQ/YmgE family stress response membrane protein n=1 Tax=Novosphingobium umbonatum TaxID=1908524 RepID=A0A3S2UT88_9SPHN|nr:GlsB/YeaQ/YmgE family stress response membrane protein [Novosphingobium umbonatum]RVU04330.1 GlsB/YeaQ/YmgE family stress response membrane protein [Novosphingobium umbonatum]
MFRILGTLMSGLFIGLVARWLYPGFVPMGVGMTILLGMGGSLFAEMVANRGVYGPPRPAGCLASVVGALALIFIGRHLGW